jgi:ribonuclease P protein component
MTRRHIFLAVLHRSSFRSTFAPIWSKSWASPPIVPGTSAASRRTAFARAWKPSGGAQSSAVVARRVVNVSQSSSRASTQEPDPSDALRDAKAGDADAGAGRRFPRVARLSRGNDIQRVIQQGKRIRTAHLDVRVLASPLAISRVGVIVPRHQQSAVDRNRVKRRLRELVRVELLPSLRGRALPVDVALRARREAYRATFADLARDVHTVRAQLASDA